MRCADCKFAEPTVLDKAGPTLECHRYPPQAFVVDGEPFQWRPQMDADESCGEYEPAP